MSNNIVVYIAEKPDIATAIASYLWKDYASCKSKHCYQKGETIVTWAYGHILMTAMPDAYGKEFADFSKYPIFPTEWKKEPSPSAKEQFKYIQDILKKASVVINGGDPDREGQLLVDEILEYVGYKGEVRRILINAKDNNSMKRAFDNIVPNDRFRPLYHAGLARERADWLVGMNLSRAYTMRAKASGTNGVWRVGRVKIPTLALVVNRERDIQNFHSVDFFELRGQYSKSGIPFTAKFKPVDGTPTDSEGRILNRAYLEKIKNDVQNRPAKVKLVEKKKQTENPPLPYSLDTLQVEANKRYGMSPSTVLAKVQSLYEKKYVSYPRSDCNYIPTSQFSDGLRILKSFREYGFKTVRDGAMGADASIKSRCFNDGKISAHHAIIPTGVWPDYDSLDEWEKKVYEMIAMRYIIQFYPPCLYDTIMYEIESQGYVFAGNGKSIVQSGWRNVVKSEDQDGVSKEIPDLSVGDIFSLPVYTIEAKKTTPPKRFTEGTLLAAMTDIWRFVSPDNPNREKLKECKGIGTPATRDSIISDLMKSSDKSNQQACIKKKGKELVPTAFGVTMIEGIHESLTKPDMTAFMEYELSAISEGRKTLQDFMKKIEEMVLQNIMFVGISSPPKPLVSTAASDEVLAMECPICHNQTLVRKYSPKTKKHFWVCQNSDCVHPSSGKAMFYNEERKKPVIRLCPQCKLPLNNVHSKKTGKNYWYCDKCKDFKNVK